MIIWQENNYKVIRLACKRCNCYVVQIGDINYLVDTSMFFEKHVLSRSLIKNNILSLSGILITHNHADHVANAQYISEKYNCPIFVAKDSIVDMKRGICCLPHGTTWMTKKLYWIVQHTLTQYMERYTPCLDVRDIFDLQFVSNIEGNPLVKIIRTPGHSIDSISILIEDKIAIIGDAFVCNLWNKKVSLPWAKDMDRARKSWKQIYDSKCQILCESHGKIVGREILENSL